MIREYRKTVTIKAEQFDGSEKMIKKYHLGHFTNPQYPWNDIATLGGYNVFPGDWLITGEHGDNWPIASDVFKRTYAELPVIPNMVAEVIELLRPEDTLFNSMDAILSGVGTLPDWVKSNKDCFARAWLDGYQVEGE